MEFDFNKHFEEMRENHYYAKSKREDGSQELLRDHLAKVSEMAGVFGEQIGSRKKR